MTSVADGLGCDWHTVNNAVVAYGTPWAYYNFDRPRDALNGRLPTNDYDTRPTAQCEPPRQSHTPAMFDRVLTSIGARRPFTECNGPPPDTVDLRMPEISVVIPVYNGAPFIEQTVASVLAQSFQDFELVLIDDHSTDGSADVISRLARAPRIKSLRTPRNGGTASAALHFALPHLRGKWFVYSSQDDHFSVDWLQKMHARAHATGADAVVPDVVLWHGRSADRRLIGVRGDRSPVITGREAVVLSLDWTIPGNALWKMEIVRQVGFAHQNLMSGDEISVRRFFNYSRRVAFCDGVFYYSQRNPQAVTKRFSPGTFDLPLAHLALRQFLAENDYPVAHQRREVRIAAGSLISSARRRKSAKFSPDDELLSEGKIARALATLGQEPDRGLLLDGATGRERVKAHIVIHGPRLFSLAIRLMPAL